MMKRRLLSYPQLTARLTKVNLHLQEENSPYQRQSTGVSETAIGYGAQQPKHRGQRPMVRSS